VGKRGGDHRRRQHPGKQGARLRARPCNGESGLKIIGTDFLELFRRQWPQPSPHSPILPAGQLVSSHVCLGQLVSSHVCLGQLVSSHVCLGQTNLELWRPNVKGWLCRVEWSFAWWCGCRPNPAPSGRVETLLRLLLFEDDLPLKESHLLEKSTLLAKTYHLEERVLTGVDLANGS
jgi:hypothetical protein